MKALSISLDSPCEENLNAMKKNSTGFFCDLCSKNVLDLTKMTPKEVVDILKASNGNICASVTKQQLETPILFFNEPTPTYKLPYSKLAAGVMLATSLANIPSTEAQNAIPYIQTELNTPILHKDHTYTEQQIPLPPKVKIFTGKVLYNGDDSAIFGAKIEFITLDTFYTAYTDHTGFFSLEIPEECINNENVIRVSYEKSNIPTKTSDHPGHYFPPATDNHILTKTEFEKPYIFKQKGSIKIAGDIGIEYSTPIPIIFYNGVKINYQEYSKMIYGKDNYYKLENKNFYYFDTSAASVLYGRFAKDGLYLFFD